MNYYCFHEDTLFEQMTEGDCLHGAAESRQAVFCVAPPFGDQRCFVPWAHRYRALIARQHDLSSDLKKLQRCFPVYYVELAGQGGRLAEGFIPYAQEHTELCNFLQQYEAQLEAGSQLALFGLSLAGILARSIHSCLNNSFCFVDSTPFFEGATIMAQGFKLGFKKFRRLAQERPEALAREFPGFKDDELAMLSFYLRHLSDDSIDAIAKEGAFSGYLSLTQVQQERFYARIGEKDLVKKCYRKLQKQYPYAHIQCLATYGHAECFVRAPKNYAEWMISALQSGGKR